MEIWNPLIKLKGDIEDILEANMESYQEDHLDRFNHSGWLNKTWRSDRFRRAHIDVVDAREAKKLWMMHVCIFPNVRSGAPVYGFDIICGQNKITGAFHDFSPIGVNDPALKFFSDVADTLSWKKERELPDWAKAIFSGRMIAVGNITSEEEVKKLCATVLSNTKWYIENMKVEDDMDSVELHNRYAYYQRQNPHTPRTMKALGLNEDDVDFFVNNCLFPKV